MIFVTGGAGFIGSNFIHYWMKKKNEPLLNLDKLTYAGQLSNLESLKENKNYSFVQADIASAQTLLEFFEKKRPRALFNFAAESHVDRSIAGPREFVQTNILGTFELLQASRHYWQSLSSEEKDQFVFVQISTDEVYGSLGPNDPPFNELTKYAPNNPYAASKASADHLVRSFQNTYGLPTIITNCTNNFGPYQYPEKLVPVVICNALNERPIPIHGDGLNIRDWLYVEDHCDALLTILESSPANEQYCIGARYELTNLQIVKKICHILDQVKPRQNGLSYFDLIVFVEDRPGNDRRYSIDPSKIENTLGWWPTYTFEQALQKTVEWYLNNVDWMNELIRKKQKDEKSEVTKSSFFLPKSYL